ncbi:MAG: hypothetical protein ACRC2Q_07335, partial [Cetobacterium sp.]
VTPPSAVLIGALAGIVCFYAIKIPRKMQWDDALDVWGVHGVGGFMGTVLIGALAGIVCFYAIKIPRKMQWDDALDVWGVHGVGGFMGTVLIGLLANGMVNKVSASSHQLWVQLFGAALVGVYSIVVSYLIMKFLDKTSNIRVTKEQIEKGLDESLLNEKYSDD